MYFWLLKHPLNTENAKVNVIIRVCIMSKEAQKYDGDFINCILNPYVPFLHDEKGTKHGQDCAGKILRGPHIFHTYRSKNMHWETVLENAELTYYHLHSGRLALLLSVEYLPK